MRHFISFVLILAVVLSFAACDPGKENSIVDISTKEPTSTLSPTVMTDVPAQVTATTTPNIPTESPTVLPTEILEKRTLSFEDHAEEILRLVPYKAYDGPLPRDAAENEVLYFFEDEGEPTALGPQLFALDGDTTVVCDFGVVPIRGMSVYDSEGRLVSRNTILLSGYRYAALVGKTLYTRDGAFNIETGEQFEEYKILADTFVCGIQWTGSVPKMIVLSNGMVSGVYTISYDYYELNGSNFWIKTNNICTKVEDYNGEWTKVTLPHGMEVTFDGVGYNVLGMDHEHARVYAQRQQCAGAHVFAGNQSAQRVHGR